MSIRIDRLDPTSERDLTDVARLATAYWREVLGPDEPATSPAEMLHHLRLERTLLLCGFAESTVGGEAFTTHVGGTTGHRERQNRVRVTDLDRSLLERWVEEGESKATGYSLVQYDDRAPDDLIAQVVRAFGGGPR